MHLTATPWHRYGKHRLYVDGPDGERLGWCDLVTGDLTVADESEREAVAECVAAWRATAREGDTVPHRIIGPAADAATPTPPTPPTTTSRPSGHSPGDEASAPVSAVRAEPAASESTLARAAEPPAETTYEDLAERRAGEMARAQATALREAAPVRTFLARVLRVHTDERAWRIGADGEEKVAAQLARLQRRDPRWHVLHAVPVGENGSDIDHVVIGPGGVFTLNTKHHPGATIWVAGSTFLVNGQKQPYLRNSRHEAARAARLLTAATGTDVEVTGVVVPVGAHDVVVKKEPEGVHVVNRRAVGGWLARRVAQLPDDAVGRLYDAARRSTTWRPA